LKKAQYLKTALENFALKKDELLSQLSAVD
jgi:hypothetical protein